MALIRNTLTSGDLLSNLTGAEISLTTTATATLSRMHVCSGTTANYTVTLPTVTGNAGKFIGFRMATGLTKLVTLTGASTGQNIDGQLTRVMHNDETCILFCDGITWSKIAGKSIPIFIQATDLNATVSQYTSVDTITILDINQILADPYNNIDLTNNTLSVPRKGLWQVYFIASLYDFSESSSEIDASIKFNSTNDYRRERRYVAYMGAGTETQSYPTLNTNINIDTTDLITPTIYTGPAIARTLALLSVGSIISLTEIIQW